MMQENLKFPHFEINEDGKRFRHSGYIEVKCLGCGKNFIVAINVDATFCGDPKCDKKLEKD